MVCTQYTIQDSRTHSQKGDYLKSNGVVKDNTASYLGGKGLFSLGTIIRNYYKVLAGDQQHVFLQKSHLVWLI